jgi:hypothetical protein
VYGVVLAVVGIVEGSDGTLEKPGGVNANLWAGVVMVAVGVAFALWSRLRPVVVEAPREQAEDRTGH